MIQTRRWKFGTNKSDGRCERPVSETKEKPVSLEHEAEKETRPWEWARSTTPRFAAVNSVLGTTGCHWGGLSIDNYGLNSRSWNPGGQPRALSSMLSAKLSRSRLAATWPGVLKPVGLQLPDAVPFNWVPHVVVTLEHRTVALLLHNCHVAAVVHCNVNIRSAGYLIGDPCERVVWPPKGIETHRLRTSALQKCNFEEPNLLFLTHSIYTY